MWLSSKGRGSFPWITSRKLRDPKNLQAKQHFHLFLGLGSKTEWATEMRRGISCLQQWFGASGGVSECLTDKELEKLNFDEIFAQGMETVDRAFEQNDGHPITVGGYSAGAALALGAMVRRPEKVQGCVLFSPALRLRPWPRIGLNLVWALKWFPFILPQFGLLNQIPLSWFKGASKNPAEDEVAQKISLVEAEVAVHRAIDCALGAIDELRRHPKPLLTVHDADDPVVSPWASINVQRDFNKVPLVTTIITEGTGHDLLPDESHTLGVFSRIGQWLEDPAVGINWHRAPTG